MPTPPKKEESQNPNQDSTVVEELIEQPTELPTVTNVKTYTEEDIQKIHNLYGTALQEKERDLTSLRERQQSPAPQHNPEQDAQQLMTDPRALIRGEIQEAIRPLAEGLQQFRAASVYDSYKNQFRSHPQYANYFNVPNFETYLDQAMQGIQQVTIPIMQEAVTRVVGYMVTNNLWNFTTPTPTPTFNPPNPNPQPRPTNGNMNLPAHLRPSGPPAPSGGNSNLTPKGNVRRALSENEARVARERGMSSDDYIDWLNVSSNQVVKSDIGRPAK